MNKRKLKFNESNTKKRRLAEFDNIHFANELTTEELNKLKQLCKIRVSADNVEQEAKCIWKELKSIYDGRIKYLAPNSDIRTVSLLRKFINQQGMDYFHPSLQLDVMDHPSRRGTQRCKLHYLDAKQGKFDQNVVIVARYPIRLQAEKMTELREILKQNFSLEKSDKITSFVFKLREALRICCKSAKCNTKSRNSRGRNLERPEIDEQTLFEMYLKQKGKCYYSNRTLKFMQNGSKEDQLSLERLDNNTGYLLSNVVFCCIQYNGVIQFTPDINEQLKHAASNDISVPQEYCDIMSVITPVHVKKKCFKTPPRQETSDGCWMCNCCKKIKHRRLFDEARMKDGSKHPMSYCRQCMFEKNEENRKSGRGFLVHLLHGCKYHSKKRKKQHEKTVEKLLLKGKQIAHISEDAFSYAINIDWVITQLRKQNGKCHVSQYPLAPMISQWNSLSIERLNEKRGYVPENCVLICSIFQNGKCQWTPDMFRRNFA